MYCWNPSPNLGLLEARRHQQRPLGLWVQVQVLSKATHLSGKDLAMTAQHALQKTAALQCQAKAGAQAMISNLAMSEHVLQSMSLC